MLINRVQSALKNIQVIKKQGQQGGDVIEQAIKNIKSEAEELITNFKKASKESDPQRKAEKSLTKFNESSQADNQQRSSLNRVVELPKCLDRPQTRRKEMDDALSYDKFKTEPDKEIEELTSSFEVLHNKLNTICETTESEYSSPKANETKSDDSCVCERPPRDNSMELTKEVSQRCCVDSGMNTEPRLQSSTETQTYRDTRDIGMQLNQSFYQTNQETQADLSKESMKVENVSGFEIPPKIATQDKLTEHSEIICCKFPSCHKQCLTLLDHVNMSSKERNTESVQIIKPDNKLIKLSIQKLPPVIIPPELIVVQTLNFGIDCQGVVHNYTTNTTNVQFIEIQTSSNTSDSKEKTKSDWNVAESTSFMANCLPQCFCKDDPYFLEHENSLCACERASTLIEHILLEESKNLNDSPEADQKRNEQLNLLEKISEQVQRSISCVYEGGSFCGKKASVLGQEFISSVANETILQSDIADDEKVRELEEMNSEAPNPNDKLVETRSDTNESDIFDKDSTVREGSKNSKLLRKDSSDPVKNVSFDKTTSDFEIPNVEPSVNIGKVNSVEEHETLGEQVKVYSPCDYIAYCQKMCQEAISNKKSDFEEQLEDEAIEKRPGSIRSQKKTDASSPLDYVSYCQKLCQQYMLEKSDKIQVPDSILTADPVEKDFTDSVLEKQSSPMRSVRKSDDIFQVIEVVEVVDRPLKQRESGCFCTVKDLKQPKGNGKKNSAFLALVENLVCACDDVIKTISDSETESSEEISHQNLDNPKRSLTGEKPSLPDVANTELSQESLKNDKSVLSGDIPRSCVDQQIIIEQTESRHDVADAKKSILSGDISSKPVLSGLVGLCDNADVEESSLSGDILKSKSSNVQQDDNKESASQRDNVDVKRPVLSGDISRSKSDDVQQDDNKESASQRDNVDVKRPVLSGDISRSQSDDVQQDDNKESASQRDIAGVEESILSGDILRSKSSNVPQVDKRESASRHDVDDVVQADPLPCDYISYCQKQCQIVANRISRDKNSSNILSSVGYTGVSKSNVDKDSSPLNYVEYCQKLCQEYFANGRVFQASLNEEIEKTLSTDKLLGFSSKSLHEEKSNNGLNFEESLSKNVDELPEDSDLNRTNGDESAHDYQGDISASESEGPTNFEKNLVKISSENRTVADNTDSLVQENFKKLSESDKVLDRGKVPKQPKKTSAMKISVVALLENLACACDEMIKQISSSATENVENISHENQETIEKCVDNCSCEPLKLKVMSFRSKALPVSNEHNSPKNVKKFGSGSFDNEDRRRPSGNSRKKSADVRPSECAKFISDVSMRSNTEDLQDKAPNANEDPNLHVQVTVRRSILRKSSNDEVGRSKSYDKKQKFADIYHNYEVRRPSSLRLSQNSSKQIGQLVKTSENTDVNIGRTISPSKEKYTIRMRESADGKLPENKEQNLETAARNTNLKSSEIRAEPFRGYEGDATLECNEICHHQGELRTVNDRNVTASKGLHSERRKHCCQQEEHIAFQQDEPVLKNSAEKKHHVCPYGPDFCPEADCPCASRHAFGTTKSILRLFETDKVSQEEVYERLYKMGGKLAEVASKTTDRVHQGKLNENLSGEKGEPRKVTGENEIFEKIKSTTKRLSRDLGLSTSDRNCGCVKGTKDVHREHQESKGRSLKGVQHILNPTKEKSSEVIYENDDEKSISEYIFADPGTSKAQHDAFERIKSSHKELETHANISNIGFKDTVIELGENSNRQMVLQSFLLYDNVNRHDPGKLEGPSQYKIKTIDDSYYKSYIDPEGNRESQHAMVPALQRNKAVQTTPSLFGYKEQSDKKIVSEKSAEKRLKANRSREILIASTYRQNEKANKHKFGSSKEVQSTLDEEKKGRRREKNNLNQIKNKPEKLIDHKPRTEIDKSAKNVSLGELPEKIKKSSETQGPITDKVIHLERKHADLLESLSEITLTISYSSSGESVDEDSKDDKNEKQITGTSPNDSSTVGVSKPAKITPMDQKTINKVWKNLQKTFNETQDETTGEMSTFINPLIAPVADSSCDEIFDALSRPVDENHTTKASNENTVNYCFVKLLPDADRHLRLADNGRYVDEASLFCEDSCLSYKDSKAIKNRANTSVKRKQSVEEPRAETAEQKETNQQPKQKDKTEKLTTDSSELEAMIQDHLLKNNARKRRPYVGKHKRNISRKLLDHDPKILVEERRNYFNNWVTYYVRKQVSPDSSAGSSFKPPTDTDTSLRR